MTIETEALKHGGDAVSLGVVILTLAQWLPSIAALLTVVWTMIRIYETDTVQRLLGRPDRAARALEAAALLATIAAWEGYQPTPYRDIAGIPTVCWGDTADVEIGHTYSRAECEARLERQALAHVAPVLRCVPPARWPRRAADRRREPGLQYRARRLLPVDRGAAIPRRRLARRMLDRERHLEDRAVSPSSTERRL